MFKAKIIAYDDKAIQDGGDYEPEILWEGQCKTPSEMMETVAEKVCSEASRLLQGYSLTVNIGRVSTDGQTS